MRKIRKGESYAHQFREVAPTENIREESISPAEHIHIDYAQILKYEKLLHLTAKGFRATDFNDYRPSKVIDAFWSRHNWNNKEQFNLFDMILLAQGAVADSRSEARALDSFLKDFLSYMIASHTVHCINRTYTAVGQSMSADPVDDIKERVRLDFVTRLSGLR